MILGLSTRVSNPSAGPPLEARVKVGETVRLTIDLTGSGPVPHQSSWVSTNPSVVSLSPDPQYGSFVAGLRATAEGESSIYADSKLRDLPDVRVDVAYCASESGTCASPTRIRRVVVVRQRDPEATRPPNKELNQAKRSRPRSLAA